MGQNKQKRKKTTTNKPGTTDRDWELSKSTNHCRWPPKFYKVRGPSDTRLHFRGRGDELSTRILSSVPRGTHGLFQPRSACYYQQDQGPRSFWGNHFLRESPAQNERKLSNMKNGEEEKELDRALRLWRQRERIWLNCICLTQWQQRRKSNSGISSPSGLLRETLKSDPSGEAGRDIFVPQSGRMDSHQNSKCSALSVLKSRFDTLPECSIFCKWHPKGTESILGNSACSQQQVNQHTSEIVTT